MVVLEHKTLPLPSASAALSSVSKEHPTVQNPTQNSVYEHG